MPTTRLVLVRLDWDGDYRLFDRYSEAKTIQSHAEGYLSDLSARGGDGRKGKGEKQIRKQA
ncbi:MAG TPA: hypothetical protein DCS60_01735 [Opitutae bacterium]|nr:hypothetical protein [Opitutae bacterium]